MYAQGVSTRKVGEITQALSRLRIGKDAVSRIAQRLDEDLSQWRDQRLSLAYPYIYLDATVLKVNWGGRVVDMHLLVAIGVEEERYREVLAVESAGGEKKEAHRNLLKGVLERGLHGVQLPISDDHKSIQAAVRAEPPDALWQRCTVHFQRNVLAHAPSQQMKSVAEDLKAVFAVGKDETARRLARQFIDRQGKAYPKAIETLQGGLDDVLTYLHFPARTTDSSARPTRWSDCSGT
jgi:putative transposase